MNMYNYSGVLYRIWGVCGIMLVLGILCIIIEQPWKHGFSIKRYKIGLILVVFAVLLALVYCYCIWSKNVSYYTGEFVETHRNSRVAPPLPVTYVYVFWNGEGEKQKFYLDTFSKKELLPYGFEYEQMYTIYFDNFTKVIVKVKKTD